jgi:hypothetical protein
MVVVSCYKRHITPNIYGTKSSAATERVAAPVALHWANEYGCTRRQSTSHRRFASESERKEMNGVIQ